MLLGTWGADHAHLEGCKTQSSSPDTDLMCFTGLHFSSDPRRADNCLMELHYEKCSFKEDCNFQSSLRGNVKGKEPVGKHSATCLLGGQEGQRRAIWGLILSRASPRDTPSGSLW